MRQHLRSAIFAKTFRTILCATAVAVGAAVSAQSPTITGLTYLVSQSNATSAGGLSQRPAISWDGGLVAFESFATDLVPGDTNQHGDIFVRTEATGLVERVSLADGGGEANGYSLSPTISGNGRFVAFVSFATNLVPNDLNGQPDVFLRDRLLGTTRLVSVSTSGAPSNGFVTQPTISFDGRFVVFVSAATNFDPTDANVYADVYVHDCQNGITELCSLSSTGAVGNGESQYPTISWDGRIVAFMSAASNLVAGDTNGHTDIFVRDRLLGTTSRASVSATGGNADSFSHFCSLSVDGSVIAFASQASNIVAGDTNGALDVFVRNLITGVTKRVSEATNNSPANGPSAFPSLSADGRYVVFESAATNLVVGDTNGFDDVFLHDCVIGTTRRVSVDSNEVQGNGASYDAAISADGLKVTFTSAATNLAVLDGNGVRDVFLRDRGNWQNLGGATPGAYGLPSLEASGILVANSNGNILLSNVQPLHPTILAVAFQSVPTSILGTVFLAFPPNIILIDLSDAFGQSDLSYTWPGGIAPGQSIFLQYAVFDPTVAAQYVVSNAVQGLTH